jgi:hypothetical protein
MLQLTEDDPPAGVPFFIGLIGFALIPLLFGARRYRIFGIVAVVVSLMFACLDYYAGLRIKTIERKMAERHLETNSLPTGTRKP